MCWLYLAAAIALEVAGTVCMKLNADNWDDLAVSTRVWLSATMLGLYALGLGAMALALRTMDASIGYALWSGIGLALVSVAGMWWLEEPVSTLKIVSLALIVAGVVGLNYSEQKQPEKRKAASPLPASPAKREALAAKK